MITQQSLIFELPKALSCPQPTENRQLNRDEVRLLVSHPSGQLSHDQFHQLDTYLQPGDVLVVNNSATLPAALSSWTPDGSEARIHLSTRLGPDRWLVEVREVQGSQTIRWKHGHPRMKLPVANGGWITLTEKYYQQDHWLHLWIAEFKLDQPVIDFLDSHGLPIKYTQLNDSFPLSYYQTFFSSRPGSSEMPSAGRGFTPALVKKLIKKGIIFAPILLHTGISSLEQGELPYPEYMEIDALSALSINEAKATGRRVIAVGTTAIRALESAVNEEGQVQPYRGTTDLYIHDSYQMRIADGLLTGFHEPRASHLNMLQTLTGVAHLHEAYQEAIEHGYYWHQFGDLHLILS